MIAAFARPCASSRPGVGSHCLLASLLPAWRATRIDPLKVLREE